MSATYTNTGDLTRRWDVTKFNNDDTECSQLRSLSLEPFDFDDDYEFISNFKVDTGNGKDVFWGMIKYNSWLRTGILPSDASATIAHFGFFIFDTHLYASNGNGVSSQTTTTLSAYDSGLTAWNTYKILFDAGTNIQYYINNSLVATHNTYMPTGTDYTEIIFLQNAPHGNGQELTFANNYTLKIN
jgi:hypothetical protein